MPNLETLQTATDEIRAALLLRFTDSNDPGLQVRRQRLRELFGSIPPEFAGELHDQLGETPTQDEFSQLFHGRLHTATRREMLAILEGRALIDPGLDKPNEPLLFPNRPLPPSMISRFNAALDALEAEVDTSGDPRTPRYRCWIDKLRDPSVEDRVIEWEIICSRETNAAAPFVTACEVRGIFTSETELFNHIEGKQDVVPANDVLHFMTHMKSFVLFTNEMTSRPLENFRRVHDDVQRTLEVLEEMTTNPSGGGSRTPRYYVAIKNWLRDQQSNPRSLYNCL